MISNQIIKKTIDDLHQITRVDFSVAEPDGTVIASTLNEPEDMAEAVRLFSASQADSQEIKGCHFFKVFDEGVLTYVLLTKGSGESVHVMGKVAASEIESLITAYKERYDRNTFIQNLILDNMLRVDIYNRARKLHIDIEKPRVVYVIQIKDDDNNSSVEILRGIFDTNGKDFITAVDETSLIFVQELEEGAGEKETMQTANMICDMLNTEAMTSVRVASGTVANDIQQVSRSYKEARTALNAGMIFYPERRAYSYEKLGIGRLIYQLPENLCELFINEVFTNEKPDTLDEETLNTINKFFESSLNVSETARQLYVHRNTLVYRLEKLQKTTGLDIRNFDDALTFRIALMITSYLNYIKSGKTV